MATKVDPWPKREIVPLDDEERAFHALTDDELWARANDFSFSLDDLKRRMNSEESWTILVQGHLFIDHVLTATLRQALPRPNAMKLNRMGFTQRLDLMSAMGLVPSDLVGLARRVNGVRNRLAHNLVFDVTDEEIASIRSAMSETFRGTIMDDPNRQIEGAATLSEVLAMLAVLLDVVRQRQSFEAMKRRQAHLNARHVLTKHNLA